MELDDTAELWEAANRAPENWTAVYPCGNHHLLTRGDPPPRREPLFNDRTTSCYASVHVKKGDNLPLLADATA